MKTRFAAKENGEQKWKLLDALIRKYLQAGRMMSVATVFGDQPWIFTAYYVSDENLNLYWISTPDTRHSKEIYKHKKVAAAIPIKFTDLTVVGMQIEGDAILVEARDEIKRVIRLYTDKNNRGEKWHEDFIAGKNEHELYRIKPRLFVLYDRETFPEDPRKEWIP